MATIKVASTVASDVAERTLKLAPARLLAFLQGVADPDIRAQFAPLGWSDERLDEAWNLLCELKGASVIAKAHNDQGADAITYCETWQSTGLIRIRALLQLSYPDQAAFLFHDVAPAKGIGAFVTAMTFLERKRSLENGTERKATHKADLEALAVLDETGTAKADIERLRDAVDAMQTMADVDIGKSVLAQETSRLHVLRKIHAWVNAWSDMARTVVSRRDQLIKLGIAKRRPAKAKAVVAAPRVAPPSAPDDL